ncbi:MAG: thiamine pyrophosphate-binding protein [Betaproteobacteria bacterium]|nr:MAG: thiamine pyrophosphate-binding protein [Betaproteobacteria bacterium]
MKNELKARTGGQLLVDALKVHGVDTAFCVPGESYLAVLDALYDAREAIKLIVCRQEGGAANMAEAYGKLTGKPGICMVTRGPGASNAAIGVHTAHQDSTPMILFIGQVGSDFVEREAFQEVDFRRMYGQLAKWVASIDRVERVPEYLSHAFHCAMSGRKGPVVLALPEDTLNRTAVAADTDPDPYQEVLAHPGAGDIAKLRAMLVAAERPLAILGGSGWNANACADLRKFIEANGLPAACAFRFQDLFDNSHANYAGDIGIGINPKLAQRVKDADLLLVIGARLGEITTSRYTLLSVPRPAQKLVHVHAGAEELGRVYQGDSLINSGMPPIAAALAAMPPVEAEAWREWTASAHADYLEWTKPRTMPGKVQLWDIVDFLKRRLPADAILANGAGNYASWLHRFYPHRMFRTQLAPTSGAMGYGVPAAIAAKIAHPQRMVVSWNGDGCFLMCGQELATAMQYGANVIFIVVNNGMYGTIRMHQEREYPARVHGTALTNPDFVLLARAYGLYGELVEETSQFAPAFERAAAAGKPALIELRIDPQAITPNTTLDALREQALKRKG